MVDMEDNYCHVNSDVFYIAENIPEPLNGNNPECIQIHRDFNDQMLRHCDCVDICEGRTCRCLPNHQTNYQRDKIGLIASSNLLTEDKVIFECNKLCTCLNYGDCGNRLVQYGPKKNLKIEKCVPFVSDKNASNILTKGYGLFTEVAVPKGSFICEYAGEVLSKCEALNRSAYNDQNNLMNYIICLNEFTNGDLMQTFVDPNKFGNIGRYMNHSCDPNCTMLPIRIENFIPKLCLFANRDIDAGSELTFSYGSERETNNKLKCLCGSKNCKMWLPNSSCQ